jgi:NAD(P)-dependent dehydrogenase (short-subunit alcohol dehydrogenase family)
MSATSRRNLEGQRALVTRARSGIGRAVALQLARDGAEAVVEITPGGKASFVAADLGDAADVQRLPCGVGDIDILINNAGIALFAATAERGHGSIVSVSSMAGGRRPENEGRLHPDRHEVM